MKRIITAINNPILNEELKKIDYIKVIRKDFQYKEAILEFLEEKIKIDIIIINEKIPGEIDLYDLIKKIQNSDKEIKVIIILENQESEKEKSLRKLNIKDIYYNEKINIKKLIDIIKEKEINIEEELKKEIERLKVEILEKKNKRIKEKINKTNKTKTFIIKNKTKRSLIKIIKKNKTIRSLIKIIKKNKIKKEKKIKNLLKKNNYRIKINNKYSLEKIKKNNFDYIIIITKLNIEEIIEIKKIINKKIKEKIIEEKKIRIYVYKNNFFTSDFEIIKKIIYPIKIEKNINKYL